MTQKKTSYDWTYTYGSPQPHAPSLIGDRAYSYDLNGNQTGWDHVQNGTRRTIVWDEENRIQEVSDNGHTKTYKYDDAGERVIKRGPQGETAYVNQFYTIRNREVGTKHVFAGGTRLVSKLVKAPNVIDLDGDGIPDDLPNGCSEPWGWTNGNGGQGNGQGPCNNNGNGNGGNGNGGNNSTGPEVFEKDQYYYHPDHLGSSSYVTDLDGEIFQHLEYFPFGETWVEEHSNTQRTPYLFTAKELDEETGLYYFGARYYDPRTSVWQSPDPILGSYLGGAPNGGVYQPINISLYAYSRHNPVGFSDSNGQFWGAASKLVKLAIKGGDVAATFAGVVEDTSTLFSSDATFGERLLAAGSLATEIVSPVSARDVKAGINAVEEGAQRAKDVRTLGRTGDAAQATESGGETVYRAMREGPNGPEVGPSARTLGARPDVDIPVDCNGCVSPGTGGMSVAPGSPSNLPEIRRPKEYGGQGKDPAWSMDTEDLGPDLTYVPDSPTHGTIQPSRTMPLEEYQKALEETGGAWTRE